MLSCRAKYGLKAVLRVAADAQTHPILAAAIASAERLPLKFLEQILLELTHRGLLHSRRGKGGGYSLARPADRVTVGEVVRSLDGALAPITCVSEIAYRKSCEGCVDETTCGVHLVMKRARDAMASVLDTTTLADVIRAAANLSTRPAAPQTLAPTRATSRAASADCIRPNPDAGRPPQPAPAPVALADRRKSIHVVNVVEPRARRQR